jgi:hypothetical protein
VRAALQPVPRTVEELALDAYSDTPTAWPPVAERSTLAILEKLLEDAAARRVGDRWAKA